MKPPKNHTLEITELVTRAVSPTGAHLYLAGPDGTTWKYWVRSFETRLANIDHHTGEKSVPIDDQNRILIDGKWVPESKWFH